MLPLPASAHALLKTWYWRSKCHFFPFPIAATHITASDALFCHSMMKSEQAVLIVRFVLGYLGPEQ